MIDAKTIVNVAIGCVVALFVYNKFLAGNAEEPELD